jgi:hypothetical protein
MIRASRQANQLMFLKDRERVNRYNWNALTKFPVRLKLLPAVSLLGWKNSLIGLSREITLQRIEIVAA